MFFRRRSPGQWAESPDYRPLPPRLVVLSVLVPALGALLALGLPPLLRHHQTPPARAIGFRDEVTTPGIVGVGTATPPANLEVGISTPTPRLVRLCTKADLKVAAVYAEAVGAYARLRRAELSHRSETSEVWLNIADHLLERLRQARAGERPASVADVVSIADRLHGHVQSPARPGV